MPTITQPARTRLTVNETWYEALFASALQPSDSPTAGMVAGPAVRAVYRAGRDGEAVPASEHHLDLRRPAA